jgi:hypothetical protein
MGPPNILDCYWFTKPFHRLDSILNLSGSVCQ